jgi:hypothetical protein
MKFNINGLCVGPDSEIPNPRPSYQINETNFGTDAAAMAGMTD